MTARWYVFKNEMGVWTVLDRGPEGHHYMHRWFDSFDEALNYVRRRA